MALRELLLTLGVEVDKQGVSNADAALGKLKKAAIVAAAAFAALKAVKGIASIVSGVTELGDEIDKTSQQLGIGVEALQEWRFAAGLAGVGGNEMSNSLGKLQKNAFEAAKGNKLLAEDFKRLGVNVKDADGNLKSADTLLTEMADGFQQLDNDTEKVALSMNLMGKSGRKLLPLFKDGAAGIADMRKEAQELGGIMDQDLINATVQLTDDQFRAQQAWQGVKNDIATAVIPVFIAFSNVMIKVAKGIRGPLKFAIGVIRNLLKAFAGTMEFVNDTFDGLGTALSTLIPILGAVGIAMLIFGRKAVIAAIKTAVSWALAALPFLLIAAVIGLMLLALEDFIGFLQGKDSLIGRFLDGFRKWVKTMGGVSGAIGKIMENLFKKIFGVSDDTARKIGGVFAAMSETVKFIFIGIPTFLGESIAKAFLAIKGFVEDVIGFVIDQVDLIIDAFETAIDIAADLIEATADALGIETDEAKTNAADNAKRNRERVRNFEKSERKRRAILIKLSQEGFGTFQARGTEIGVSKAGQAQFSATAALTGITDDAALQARFRELSQDINAPLTVNVDARGQDNPAGIADATATAVNKGRDRQTKNQFAIAAPAT